MKLILSLCLLCFSFAASAQTYYVLRHFEKVQGVDNPPLSDIGQAQAQTLAVLLADKGLQCIYSTDYVRTRSSVEPLATKIHTDINLYDPRQPDALIEQMRKLSQDCVIVGHSNTVADIVTRLGGTAKELTEKDYGDVFMVVTDNKGSTQTYRVNIQ
ncbi:SixA phosphatase family protein [Alteromonas facilis]|uniref:SixA phosphatase family protein n=1 Tax=Alteromonas facilis TaxID=2048004 RepID=UPI000C28F3D7|nr:histidine phosphatase family protein [Alteromonas facilis]